MTMVTTIGLPLLIISGQFRNIYSLTVEELESFIPFLVKCSVMRAGARQTNEVPEWWPPEFSFQFPLHKPVRLSRVCYRRRLRSLVFSCYWYHNAQFLLQFSAKVAENPHSFYLQNNDDNTTSVFNSHNAVQIMKFSNENKNYDAEPKKIVKNTFKSLLPSQCKKTIPILNIYLCENCDAEFSSHSDMQEHEKKCTEIVIDDDVDDDGGGGGGGSGGGDDDDDEDGGDDSNDSGSNYDSNEDKNKDIDSDSSPEIEILEHIKPSNEPVKQPTKETGKDSLMNYLGLQHTCNQNLCMTRTVQRVFNHGSPSKRWVNIDRCLHKNGNIEFSSSYGRKILENCVKRDLISKIEKKISLYEAHCGISVKTSRELRELSDFKVSYKKRCKPKWVHHYTFGKCQRIKQYNRLKTGLSERSQRLLKQCKKVRIVLNRINFPS